MRLATRLLLVTLLAACGGGDSGTNVPPPPPPPPPAPAPIATITVSIASSTISIGAGTQATAVLRDAAGNTLTGRAVSWSSSASGVATVSSTGQITAVSAGSTTITASSEGSIGTAQLTVAPPPVASVSVVLANPTLVVGGTTAAVATMLDAGGDVLNGRAVSWSSSNSAIASVAANGQVTAVTPGTVSIIATSEGRTGSAQLTVTQPPVATLQVFGTQRVKVGDSYQLTVEARLADGTLVQRPITWNVAVPGSLTISGSGVLTALQTGTLNFSVTVDGVTTNASVTAYGWTLTTSAQRVAADLSADIQITNRFGTAEYPTLVISCLQGTVLVYVSTENFVTASGLVSYSFNSGTIFSENWIEFGNFSSLGFPALTNLTSKNFAALIAASSTFDFAFTEFQSVARATRFRVTGLTPFLNQVLAACPSNALRAENNEGGLGSLFGAMSALRSPTPMDAQRELRSTTGAAEGTSPAAALTSVRNPEQVLLSVP